MCHKSEGYLVMAISMPLVSRVVMAVVVNSSASLQGRLGPSLIVQQEEGIISLT